MFLDRLPNRLNLSSRGLDLDSISCMVYNGSVESNAHTFFTCDTAVVVWRLVHSWIGFSFPSFLSCEDWISWFDSWLALKDKKSKRSGGLLAWCQAMAPVLAMAHHSVVDAKASRLLANSRRNRDTYFSSLKGVHLGSDGGEEAMLGSDGGKEAWW
ncbi:hypothetical protein Tco_1480579, partial [Tanacetum coccineum]